MPRGAPDYSNVKLTKPLHRIDDLAELAARLSSPVTHDRAGNVVFIESFTFGTGDWQIALSGTGAAVTVVPTPYRTGPFSLKMTAGTTASKQAKIFRKFPYPQLGKYGLEFSWKPDTYTTQLRAKLVYHDGTYDREFGVDFKLADKLLRVRDSEGTWQTVDDDLYLDYSYAPFHTFKIVADFETNEFVRLIVNDNVYTDLPYEAYSHETTDGKNVRVDIILWGEAAYNGSSYIDDVILTQNEP